VTGEQPMIGEQLARLRRINDITQEQLAERAGLSVDVVRRLEQGARTAARINSLAALAKALGAQLSVIIAPRSTFAPDPDNGVAGIRRAITTSTLGLDDFADSDTAPALDQLTAATQTAWGIWQKGDYSILGRLLPGLIVEARAATQDTTNEDQLVAWSLLATAYELAAGVTIMLGHEDLAWLAAERAIAAAEHCGDPVANASATHWAAWILRRQGRYADCQTVATRAAERHEPSLMQATPEQLTVWGGLLVNASGAAARDEHTTTATELLSVAKAAAGRLSADRADRWSVFGPRIVAQTAVVNATEAGDFDTAVRAATEVDRVGGRVPGTWEARYLLALAQAQVETGQHHAAITALTKARTATPEWVRYHRLARDLTIDLTNIFPTGRQPELDAMVRHLQRAA
jgi:transcriptional regulator with XRE-family HTH domain